MKVLKLFKEVRYLNFPIALGLTASSYFSWLSGGWATWPGLFLLSPFLPLVILINDLTDVDSSSYEPLMWVLIFMYYSFLTLVLLLLFKNKKMGGGDLHWLSSPAWLIPLLALFTV